ncbi:PAB1 binding protein [Mycoemilia scoparia]|uniref:PAB1 binding protein n=1 Tax=Mycoemilia scoparia TaxID=417184 RepID=A0A9W8A5N3_9FUNG|nr:PAB1 binding protein [Mycoemilia scoparia]
MSFAIMDTHTNMEDAESTISMSESIEGQMDEQKSNKRNYFSENMNEGSNSANNSDDEHDEDKVRPTKRSAVSSTYNDAQKSSGLASIRNTKFTMRIVVYKEDAENIFGAEYAEKDQMEQRSQTNIKIITGEGNPGATKDRVIGINGILSNICKALFTIAEALLQAKERAQNSDSNADTRPRVSLRVLVPHRCVGSIMGRGGNYISSVRSKAGVDIHTSESPLAQSSERIVEIVGTPRDIENALNMIGEPLLKDIEVYNEADHYVPSENIESAMLVETQARRRGNARRPNSGRFPGPYNNGNGTHRQKHSMNDRHYNNRGPVQHQQMAFAYQGANNPYFVQQPGVAAGMMAFSPNNQYPGMSAQVGTNPYTAYSGQPQMTYGYPMQQGMYGYAIPDPAGMYGRGNVQHAGYQQRPRTMSRAQGYNNNSRDGASSGYSQQISIPEDRAGAVIGRKGEFINFIRTKFNVNVNIPDRVQGQSNRIATVRGSQGDVAQAIAAIQQKVVEGAGQH